MSRLLTISETAATCMDKHAFAQAVGFPWRSLRPVAMKHGIGSNLNGRWTFDAHDVVLMKAATKVKPCPTTSTNGPTVSIDCAGLITESQQVTEALKLAREIRQNRARISGHGRAIGGQSVRVLAGLGCREREDGRGTRTEKAAIRADLFCPNDCQCAVFCVWLDPKS